MVFITQVGHGPWTNRTRTEPSACVRCWGGPRPAYTTRVTSKTCQKTAQLKHLASANLRPTQCFPRGAFGDGLAISTGGQRFLRIRLGLGDFGPTCQCYLSGKPATHFPLAGGAPNTNGQGPWRTSLRTTALQKRPAIRNRCGQRSGTSTANPTIQTNCGRASLKPSLLKHKKQLNL